MAAFGLGLFQTKPPNKFMFFSTQYLTPNLNINKILKTHFSNFPFSSSSIVDKKISKNLELLIDLNIDLYITLKSSWV